MAIVINDLHLGVQRQAGTTPFSQLALKRFVMDEFRDLVSKADGHLIINGDLFDGFFVDPSVVIEVDRILTEYLQTGYGPILSEYLQTGYDPILTLVMGNHDASAKGDKTSSFHLLAYMLVAKHGEAVQVIDHTHGLSQVEMNTWAIPHMLNQALFDLEVEKAIAARPGFGFLLVHCNIMSPFAEHSDHSLNLNEAQLDALVDAGWTLIVGHEHQARFTHGKRVIVTGNQIPTSVADCLNNPHNTKVFCRLTDREWELIDWTCLDDLFAKVKWRDLDEVSDIACFVRVEGDCTSEESAEMVSAIAKFRQKSNAFVVTNAVKVEGVAQMEALAEMNLESMSKFDVLGALLEELDEREATTVKELLK